MIRNFKMYRVNNISDSKAACTVDRDRDGDRDRDRDGDRDKVCTVSIGTGTGTAIETGTGTRSVHSRSGQRQGHHYVAVLIDVPSEIQNI